jgi:hypothetical protein
MQPREFATATVIAARPSVVELTTTIVSSSTVRAGWRAAATPQVDDLLTAPVRSDGSADLAALDEVAVELGTQFLEARSDPTGPAGSCAW